MLTSIEECSHPTRRTAQDTVAIAGNVNLISDVVRMEDSHVQNLLPASLLAIILDRARSFFAPNPLSSPYGVGKGDSGPSMCERAAHGASWHRTIGGPKGRFSSLDFLRGRLCGGRACSIAWIMHWPPKPGTAGSNPAAPATSRTCLIR